MIAHFEIEQHSENWHKIKHVKIGGTRAKNLFIESDNLFVELLSEKCEYFELQESYQNFDMQRGNELEPEARKYLSDYLGVNFLECGWLQCEKNQLLGLSPDGITKNLKISAEIKCLSAKKHTEIILENKVPKEHLAQCLQYFNVNPKLEKHYFISYRPENLYKPAFIFEFNRQTIVDLGFKERGKIKEDRGLGLKEYVCEYPVLKTVDKWCEIMQEKADQIKEKLKLTLETLKF